MAKLDFSVTLAAREHPARYVVGQTMVGCLQHDAIVWSMEREGWICPICGFAPTEEAEKHPLVVTYVDCRNGIIKLG